MLGQKQVSTVKKGHPELKKPTNFALHYKVDFEGAMEWLKHYDKNIKDRKEFEGTREAFFEALQLAIPGLSEKISTTERLKPWSALPDIPHPVITFPT